MVAEVNNSENKKLKESVYFFWGILAKRFICLKHIVSCILLRKVF